MKQKPTPQQIFEQNHHQQPATVQALVKILEMDETDALLTWIDLYQERMRDIGESIDAYMATT